MKKDIVPDNAIDRFVYKTKRITKNVGMTIKESETIRGLFSYTLPPPSHKSHYKSPHNKPTSDDGELLLIISILFVLLIAVVFGVVLG
jgi:hypothetical protein